MLSNATTHPFCDRMLAFNEGPALEDEISTATYQYNFFFFLNFFRLPGKAFAQQRYVWLTGANEVDSKVFSRAILAKVSVL